MLGYLLARAGVDVVVLEKHADFLRDFRGDTIHPSTLEVVHELGLLDEFLKRPHQEIREVGGQFGDEFIPLADLTHLPTHCKFMGFMPQWDFLNFFSDQGRKYPQFHLLMEAEVTDLIIEGNTVAGVKATTPSGEIEVRATLTVGCDGRKSLVRERADLQIQSLGAPIDVLWFRLNWRPGDPQELVGVVRKGLMMAMIYRSDYWQIAYLMPKGENPRDGSLETFKERLVSVQPNLAQHVNDLHSWEDTSQLDVRVDRLKTWWRRGLLCISDAAHAMSPVGGVGINLAVADAVGAANILCGPLRENRLTDADLAKVQRRRELPAKIIQAGQVFIQNNVIEPNLNGDLSPVRVPKIVGRGPLQFIPPIIVGRGFRPEHVRTPDVHAI